MSKEMLINVSEGEECRIALIEDGRLEELYMERTSATSHVGNIYKGRVTNVEPSIQAAFVDFGLGRNGFLHISDLMPTYFGREGSDYQETVGRKMARRDRPPIQRCLRRGDEIIVQIIKEGIGTKGPTLTSYISIPGRMLVMMPGMGKMGVSKKIEDEEERRRLRTILDSLKPPKGVAFIIRTAGVGKTKTEIERDLKYLTRVWETIEKKRKEPGPIELYTEGDLVTRTVRDVFTNDVEKITVDSKDVAKRVKDVIKITAPRTKNKVEVYEGTVPLFHEYGIEKDIELMYSRHVPLPSGGSLVIDSTEAIVAIDVNSGKNRESGDAETTAFRVDMEAADEICRQLKLRDLGGVIICDFIDLRYDRHRRELEKRLDDNFKRDRAKTKVLRMSQFGIIEMTRQRMRPSLKRSVYFDCPHCKGAGLVKTPESMALDVMRKLAIAINNENVVRVELSVCPDVAFSLLNKKRQALSDLENETGKKILIRSDALLGLDEVKFALFDERDGAVIVEELGMSLPQMGHVTQLGTRGGRRGQRDNRRGRDRGPAPAGRPAPHEPQEDDDARFARESAEEAQEADEREHETSRAPRDTSDAAPAEESDEHGDEEAASARPAGEPGEPGSGSRRRRRRRGRRGRGNGGGEAGGAESAGTSSRDNNASRDNARQDRRDERPAGVAAYDRGRRPDGSFENVTELETVDFGDDDAEEETSFEQSAGGSSDANDRPRGRDNARGSSRGAGGRGEKRSESGGRSGRSGQSDRSGRSDQSTGRAGGSRTPVRVPPKPLPPTEESDGTEHEHDEPNGNVRSDENGNDQNDGGAEGPRKRRRRRGGRRHRRQRENQLAREAAQSSTPATKNESDSSDVDLNDDAEGAVEKRPATASRRQPVSADAASSRGRQAPAAPLPVVKTGSSDKHLVTAAPEEEDDLPAVEESPEAEVPVRARRRSSRRPSSFTDLDAIPDDYD